MRGNCQDPNEEKPEAVRRLEKFRGCTDAWESEAGEIITAWSHDKPTGRLIGSRPQEEMISRGYAVTRVSSKEDYTSITYRKMGFGE